MPTVITQRNARNGSARRDVRRTRTPDKARGCDAGCIRLLGSYKSRPAPGREPILSLREAGGGDLLLFKTACNFENGKVA